MSLGESGGRPPNRRSYKNLENPHHSLRFLARVRYDDAVWYGQVVGMIVSHPSRRGRARWRGSVRGEFTGSSDPDSGTKALNPLDERRSKRQALAALLPSVSCEGDE